MLWKVLYKLLALFTTPNEAYINGSHCRPLASALQQSYQKSDKFPPVFLARFFEIREFKVLLVKAKAKKKEGSSFPYPHPLSATKLGDLLDFGNFLKPLAIINLPKSPTFLGNFCKGVKMYNFSLKIIFGQLL